MNILAIGDIVGEIGVKKIVKELPKLKEKYNIDFCIINGENSAGGMGITKKIFDEHEVIKNPSIDKIFEVDHIIREKTRNYINTFNERSIP